MTEVVDGPGWAPPGGPPELAELLQRLSVLSGRGMKLGLHRIEAALERLGNPQDSFRSVHIAGSNGKGSTAAFTANILACAGHRVGLYSSPHLELVTERIRVWPGTPEGASPEQFIRWVDAVEAVDPGFEELSFFEVLTLAAFVGFEELGVEIAVIEAGLGARLDATRVVDSEVAVLTTVSLEHTGVLGETLAEVAWEEAWVMRPERPFFAAARAGTVREEVLRLAAEQNVAPKIFGLDFGSQRHNENLTLYDERGELRGAQLGLLGEHQEMNAALAFAAARTLDPKLSDEHIHQGLKQTRWPGRLEDFEFEGVCVRLDGAQNAFAAQTLARALAEEGDAAYQVVFACLSDKDAGAMLEALTPHAAAFVFCWAPSPRSRPPSDYDLEAPESRVVADPIGALRVAVQAARERGQDVLVCGSLYLVGRIRGFVRKS